MDDQIKELLLSDEESRRREGMTLLVESYQTVMYVVLVAWNLKRHRPLVPDDLADIWQDALVSIWENVQFEKFGGEGSLNAYIQTIVRRRAADELRRRRKEQYNELIDELVKDSNNLYSLHDLLEAIRVSFPSLTDGEKFMLKIEVDVFWKNYGSVSNKQLAIEVNRVLKERGEGTKTLRAVKSSRERARNHICEELRKRGYDE